ncbi:hypothetical protein EDC04DRAFT_2653264 [Pisolithus marmoratus]|nr:hypothetical protein EDC04DRAFT_2653264 [Pisolithus marmoratus]
MIRAGLFFNIFLMVSKVLGVSLGRISSAFRFLSTWSGSEALRITMLVFRFRATQANARCTTLQPSSVLANLVSP